MIPINCSTQTILDTNITTFTVEPCKANRDTTEHLVYIASVSKEKTEITVRPINPNNAECISECDKIVSSGRLAIISQTASKILLHVHERGLTALPLKACKLKLELGKEIIELGNISSYSKLKNDCYGLYVKYFSSFIQIVRQQQQKSGKDQLLEDHAINVK